MCVCVDMHIYVCVCVCVCVAHVCMTSLLGHTVFQHTAIPLRPVHQHTPGPAHEGFQCGQR